ncbi:DUF4160 domain-containing protein [Candidatus Poriferisocius sp.]|uniref:DUF4160 domain-containing protein n=1 Tax=Candidatus Poriferisocius sp. TaxID=3101276 RepID=UPI003B02CDA3
MPELCRFYGIVIQMYYGDHSPPHFHARYGSYRAVIDIDSLAVIGGCLTPRATGLVIEWAAQHRRELSAAWRSAERNENPGKTLPCRNRWEIADLAISASRGSDQDRSECPARRCSETLGSCGSQFELTPVGKMLNWDNRKLF